MDALDTSGPAGHERIAERVDGRVVSAGPGSLAPPDDAPDAFLIVLDADHETDGDPLRLCRETSRRSPATAVIGLGPEARLADGFQLLRLGAVSWITTDPVEPIDPATVVQATLAGESVLHARHAAWVMADFAALSASRETHDPRYNLTATEREVLIRLAKGQSSQDIADLHDVEVHLVNRHVRLALTRLHHRTR